MNGFRRNLVLRIDHILQAPELATRCPSCSIGIEQRRLERPSGHTAVVAELRD